MEKLNVPKHSMKQLKWSKYQYFNLNETSHCLFNNDKNKLVFVSHMDDCIVFANHQADIDRLLGIFYKDGDNLKLEITHWAMLVVFW